ncbi:HAMP domain-containing sensor histidine kinase [Raineyella sp. W15-4]|uniref:sensor histidine kinase n=1 Tax=Raineyella sp. W15-4 TaxID=3081651 RepID=UPI0029543145|nr:HAMP domain-containing sensor histidine kinase [Raineyella sp. W15-4]WOQ16636.1 HAMP domain-containing sensor histidine kinase [Raineyella sp. W15-4]
MSELPALPPQPPPTTSRARGRPAWPDRRGRPRIRRPRARGVRSTGAVRETPGAAARPARALEGTASHRLTAGPLPARGTLTRQLVVQVSAIIAVVAIALGFVTTLIAQRVLMRQLDDRLTAVLTRQQTAATTSGQGFAGGIDLPGQPIGTVVVVITDQASPTGTVTPVAQNGVLTPDGFRPVPSNAALRTLYNLPVGSGAHSVDLELLGGYRAMAVQNGQDRVIVGLPLTETRTAVATLVWTATILSLLAVAASVITVYVVVVRKMRPLTDLAAVARQVSAMPLSEGYVDLGPRVPPPRSPYAAEVTDVGEAINQMLGHVEWALQARQVSESWVRRFVADASHELRNPLAAIRGYAELTRRERDAMPPQTGRALDRIDAEAERMSALVEDLLLLARLDSKATPAHQPVDLTEIVVNALADAQAAGPDHSWSLDVPTEPVMVVGDRHQLHQVVANLLANARTHTPSGARVMAGLSVAFAAARPGQREAVVTVHDNGPGIPSAMIAQVFDRFVRADSARARIRDASAPNGSTGLGLSIVAAVVTAHRGQVTVTSRCADDLTGPEAEQADTWTTFTVRLPLAPVAD